MELFKKLSNWLKYSKTGSDLSIYERITITNSNHTKCPYCKQKSVIDGNSEHFYMASFHYCETCGFSYTDQVLPFRYVNQGVNLNLINHNKARVLKIKTILKKGKNENRCHRFKIFR